MNKILHHIIGILSLLYLMNIGVGVIELIPDNMPIVGNLDEATATILLMNYLRYLGIDLFNLFKGKEKDIEPKQTHNVEKE
jgi:hypothetical protein